MSYNYSTNDLYCIIAACYYKWYNNDSKYFRRDFLSRFKFITSSHTIINKFSAFLLNSGLSVEAAMKPLVRYYSERNEEFRLNTIGGNFHAGVVMKEVEKLLELYGDMKQVNEKFSKINLGISQKMNRCNKSVINAKKFFSENLSFKNVDQYMKHFLLHFSEEEILSCKDEKELIAIAVVSDILSNDRNSREYMYFMPGFHQTYLRSLKGDRQYNVIVDIMRSNFYSSFLNKIYLVESNKVVNVSPEIQEYLYDNYRRNSL